MRSKLPLTLCACLWLVALMIPAEAFFNFGSILRTASVTMNGVSQLINTIFNDFTPELTGFVEDDEYKPRLISTNSLCQMTTKSGQEEADKSCDTFGRRYYPRAVGEWGCGSLRKDQQYACLWKASPKYLLRGLRVPEVILRRDERRSLSDDDDQCMLGRRARHPSYDPADDEPADDDLVVVDDEIDPEIKDTSHYYSKTLLADMNKYAESFEETQPQSSSSESMLAIEAIVQSLSLVGIRYPIGKRVCQLCKGTCNKIMSGSNLNTCKYDACVKFLGGYKGSDAAPSCSQIARP